MDWSLYLNIESAGNLLQLVKNSRRRTKKCVKTHCVSGLDCVLRKLVFTRLLWELLPHCSGNLIWSSVHGQPALAKTVLSLCPLPFPRGPLGQIAQFLAMSHRPSLSITDHACLYPWLSQSQQNPSAAGSQSGLLRFSFSTTT